MTQVPEYTKDEALAFVDAIRGTLSGKVGFKWLVGRLSGLSSYIESTAAENERLNAFLDRAGMRDEYESCRASDSPRCSGGPATPSVGPRKR